MNEGFKDWLMGMSVFFIVAIILYIIGKVINPINSFSFMEWWGIVMMVIVVRSGYMTYYEYDDE